MVSAISTCRRHHITFGVSYAKARYRKQPNRRLSSQQQAAASWLPALAHCATLLRRMSPIMPSSCRSGMSAARAVNGDEAELNMLAVRFSHLTQLAHGRPQGSHARPFRGAIVIRLSRPSAESGRNKGMSQTSAKRVELASCPCSIGKVLHSSERGLALGVLGRRCCCTSWLGRRRAAINQGGRYDSAWSSRLHGGNCR